MVCNKFSCIVRLVLVWPLWGGRRADHWILTSSGGGSIDWSIGRLVWFYTSVAPVSKPHNCVFGGFNCGANSAKSKQEQNLSLWNNSLPQNYKDEINWHKCVFKCSPDMWAAHKFNFIFVFKSDYFRFGFFFPIGKIIPYCKDIASVAPCRIWKKGKFSLSRFPRFLNFLSSWNI